MLLCFKVVSYGCGSGEGGFSLVPRRFSWMSSTIVAESSRQAKSVHLACCAPAWDGTRHIEAQGAGLGVKPGMGV